jgi:HEAT repeat protein
MDSHPTIDWLIADLGDQDIAISLLAQQALATLGPAAVQPLIAALGSENTRQTAAAVIVLGKLGDPRARSSLMALFDHPAAVVRMNAARALVSLRDEHTVLFLGEWLVSEPNGMVQTALIEALDMLGDRRALDILLMMLDRVEAPSLRYLIIRALGNLGDVRSISAILPFIHDEDHHVRSDAQRALEKLGYLQS